MTILRLEDLRSRVKQRLDSGGREKIAKSLKSTNGVLRWSAFFSYRTMDRDVAFEAAQALKEVIAGLSIYVDAEDPGLSGVSSEKAASRLRQKVASSDLLLVAVTSKSPSSRWIPWELGLADGQNKRVAVVPCLGRDKDGLEFAGQEYLGLYPWLDVHLSTQGNKRAWANTLRDTYVVFEDWMAGAEPKLQPVSLS